MYSALSMHGIGRPGKEAENASSERVIRWRARGAGGKSSEERSFRTSPIGRQHNGGGCSKATGS
jgi:hypothetical protein